MTMPQPLPLGILLPTRNVRPHLPRHILGLRPWLPLVQEIVVVDSESTDGTMEFLRKELAGLPVRFHNRPPGLYAAWNFGLQQLHATWTYISTIGDVITASGLGSLVQTASTHEADVVISPPSFTNLKGRRLDRRWPIHEFLHAHPLSSPALIPPLHAFLWSALFLPGSILGSSASNLYRTQTLQSHPFPETFRHAGDTAWAVQHLLTAKTVLVPESFATFMVHDSSQPSPRGSYNPNRMQLLELARQSWQNNLPRLHLQELESLKPKVEAFLDLLHDLFTANQAYHQSRHAPWPWFLSPRAWRQRARKEALSRQIRRLRCDILLALDTPPQGQGRQ